MSNSALEEIIKEGFKSLPPDEQRQLRGVLDDVEVRTGVIGVFLAMGLVYLLGKRAALPPEERERLDDLLNHAMLDAGLVTKADLVREVRGKYAHLGMSSEAFAAQKLEEIRLEDRR